MNQKEFNALIITVANKRYEYFVKKVVDSEVIWGLNNGGWAMTLDDKGESQIPFWPSKEFALFCATDEWENYIPQPIDLHEFLDEWLPGMAKDNYNASIFFNKRDSAILSSLVLEGDLREELNKY